MQSVSTKLNSYRLQLTSLGLFCLSLADGSLAKLISIPGGVVTTLAELVLAAMIFVAMKNSPDLSKVKYVAIPVCIGVGDFFYGLANYALKLPFPNQFGCLLYVLPYILGLVLIISGLTELARNAKKTQPGLLAVGGAAAFGILVVIVFNLVIPALLYKQPPLSLLMKSLTVAFSVLESAVIGGAVILLLCARGRALQVGLFGILVMHISDMALRYQSVKLDLMGMSLFENGWCLGLTLLTIAALTVHKSEKIENTESPWLPLSSIRGATIGFVLLGFIIFWLMLSVFFKSIGSAPSDAGSLLILTAAFAFAVIVADFVTAQVTRIVLRIESQSHFENALDSPLVPYEIKVITRHFKSLAEQIEAEKDKVFALTSSVSHDLRGPLDLPQFSGPLISS